MSTRKSSQSACVAAEQNRIFWFVLPASFNPREYLPTDLKCYADDARYCLSLIYRKMALRSVDDDDPIRLNAQHLRRIMHNRHAAAIVQALKDGGAIERFPYSVGQASFGYRLARRFIGDKHVRVAPTDPRIIRRLAAFYESREGGECQERMLPVHRKLAELQKLLEIDATAARQILSCLPPKSNKFDLQGILVENIVRREFYLSVGQFGRVFNNITCMKRELRRALRWNKEPLFGVDLSCAQPAFLARLALEKALGKKQEEGKEEQNKATSNYDAPDLPPDLMDLQEFRRLTQCGEFYDFMIKELAADRKPMAREALKKRVLADVLAKKKTKHGNEYPSVVEEAFARLFPSVYQFIRVVNREGWEHENLIRELQRQESKLVIETVAADLVTAHPGVFFASLHDAIFTTKDHMPKVVAAFEKAFERTGFRIKYKVGEH